MVEEQSLFSLDRPQTRVDGVAKVTGAARYAADEPVRSPAYACAVTSRIARGHIRAFRFDEARAVPGVIEIFTYQNLADALRQPPRGPDGKATTTMMQDAKIWHDGQLIALVVADSAESAQEAAYRVQVEYDEEHPAATFDDAGVQAERTRPMSGKDPARGDAAEAFRDAPIRIDARYSTPTQHHNAIELFSTTCEWDGRNVTVYDPAQFMRGTQETVASQLGLEAGQVRAVSRFVGGAFGGKGPHPRSPWIVAASRRVGRSVRFVATRQQGFTVNTFRAETRHHLRLGATRDGRLVSLQHDGEEITSRPSQYSVGGTDATARMYGCPNIATSVTVVHADRNTPGYMRAPPETPYMFALESAMDELATGLGMDPIELRRVNDTQTDPVSGLPFSSRALMKCFDAAAREFGWSRRSPKPRSMTAGDWWVGYGCATACYPSNCGPAAVRVALLPGGRATVQMAGHEIGNGAYTVAAVTAARALGLDVPAVTVTLGDSDLPPVVIAGGSSNTASMANAVAMACEQIRARLAQGANASGNGGHLEAYAEWVPSGMPPQAMRQVSQGQPALYSGTGRKDVAAFAFGAHLVEVRVHQLTREIRVPRSVSAFAAGTIVNPLAARSQFMGGVIWGISAALHEQTEIDRRAARYVNANLADYLIPVNADVPEVGIIVIPEQDTRVNPLGIKGIGEIGIVGMNAAIANAVFHATGKRIRDLPIRAEHLLDV